MRLSGHGFTTFTMLALAAGGIGPLALFAWFNKLGDFAKSPQTVELNLGTQAFVAGGRARLWFSSVEAAPQVEVSCRGQSRLLEVTDEPSDEVCGIRIKTKRLEEVSRGRFTVLRGTFVVTWNDKRN